MRLWMLVCFVMVACLCVFGGIGSCAMYDFGSACRPRAVAIGSLLFGLGAGIGIAVAVIDFYRGIHARRKA